MRKYLKIILILSAVLVIGLVACNDDAPSPAQPPISATPIPIEEPIDDPGDDPPADDGVLVDLITLDNCLAFASCTIANMSTLTAEEQNELTGFHNVVKASQLADPTIISEQDKYFCKQKMDKFTEALPMCPLPASFGTLSDQ